MIRPIKTSELKVGMFIMLGNSAHLLPLFEEEFMISSEKQIANIQDKGITLVDVDVDKSEAEVPAPDFDSMETVAEGLREAIEDPNLAPKDKASAVYNHTLKMMENIIAQPTAENILSGKNMIHDVVELILADTETADFLTQITSHDYYTYTHSVNVGMLGVLLSKAAFGGEHDHDLDELGSGFFLHDLGKCEVPSYLINKPGRLTDKEWEQMRMHPSYGERILADAGELTHDIKVIVLQHHERWNGAGYPLGLEKSDIHIYARICSIADVYDALTATRAYKKKLSTFEALSLMKEEMMEHFEQDLFARFVRLFN
ncbi:MAG: HD domain-containing protein [Candidatus Marinimicrobia bacterium]|nr:HD domain-containing protein [Candidatus Neomarinimicrobiota bacterium]